MSDLVGNPGDRFSHDTSQIYQLKATAHFNYVHIKEMHLCDRKSFKNISYIILEIKKPQTKTLGQNKVRSVARYGKINDSLSKNSLQIEP